MSDNFKLDFNNLDTLTNFRNPLQDMIDDANREKLQQIAAIEAMHREKRKEEQRKFEELLETTRSSSSNINIGGVMRQAFKSSKTRQIRHRP